ncbi:alpha/beta hydrolase [Myxococcota bacterium]|nr:alpha/beta hydrolase [Myxococcota bacterium]
MGVVLANGARVNFVQLDHEDPEAEDIVMIHGLATNLAFWYLQVAPELNRDYRVTLYDLRGHGRSERTASGYAPEDLARDLEALLDQLGIERAHFLAHSFGGVVALNFACRAEERFLSLLLADSHIGAVREDADREDWDPDGRCRQILDRHDIALDTQDPYFGYRLLKVVAGLRLRGEPIPEELQGLVNPLSGGCSARTANQWFQLLDETSAEQELTGNDNLPLERLSELSLPLLAMYGEESPAMSTGQRLLSIWPHAHFRRVREAGHFFPMTRPQEVIRGQRALAAGELAQPASPRRGEQEVRRFRSDRLQRYQGAWYFDTREGGMQGPFSGADEARAKLNRYLADVTGRSVALTS